MNADTLETSLLTWSQRVFQMWSQLCRNLRTHEHDEHSDTVLPKSAEIRDTCIRPRECVCGSTISTASAVATAVRAAARGVAALSLIPSCLGVSGHPSGSRQGHPRYTGARSAGRPWVAHEIRQHCTQCRNTPNMVAEQCRSRARGPMTSAERLQDDPRGPRRPMQKC